MVAERYQGKKKREGTIGVAWRGRGREKRKRRCKGESNVVDKPKTRRMRREKQRRAGWEAVDES